MSDIGGISTGLYGILIGLGGGNRVGGAVDNTDPEMRARVREEVKREMEAKEAAAKARKLEAAKKAEEAKKARAKARRAEGKSAKAEWKAQQAELREVMEAVGSNPDAVNAELRRRRAAGGGIA
jgi:hypothetical protein